MNDQRAIVELVERCAGAVGDGDGDTWAATWVDDATWNLMGTEMKGIETIRQTWEGAVEMFDGVVQRVHSGTIDTDSNTDGDTDGDTATGRWLVSELTGTGDVMLGYYDDDYVRTDDGWRFRRRVFNLVGQGPAIPDDTSAEIVLVGKSTLDPARRDEAVAAGRVPMENARAQDGCLAYVFSADPVDDDTIAIHEHWRDAASLAAHLAGPHYMAMLQTLAGCGLTGVSVSKHEIRRSGAVYNDEGVATASFEGC